SPSRGLGAVYKRHILVLTHGAVILVVTAHGAATLAVTAHGAVTLVATAHGVATLTEIQALIPGKKNI
ncbi:MAG: hypothetical protein K2O60_03325, partial [Ruminococcus sp.]|nr:hypothetical protein [Ruminococcus sp.]